MLAEIRNAIGRLIAEYGGISPVEVDVRHEAPTREWIDRLTRPTINCYLFDLRENTDLRWPGMQTVRGGTSAIRRTPPRRIDLDFMVSALTTEVEDEDALLWRVLSTMLKYAEWPDDLVPEAVRALNLHVTTRLEHDQEASRLADVWGGLQARPRPALWYAVTVPLDLEREITTPLVLTRFTRTRDIESDRVLRRSLSIAGTVRSKDGMPLPGITILPEDWVAEAITTLEDGRFVFHNPRQGSVRLRVTAADGTRRVVTLQVPGDSYDIILD
jgi:hypothetical protein